VRSPLTLAVEASVTVFAATVASPPTLPARVTSLATAPNERPTLPVSVSVTDPP
jgi:hypothetical protein